MSSFASGKFALRATGQSLAREFGPKGIHVAHVIVDGVIDIPRTRDWPVNGGVPDGKINSDAVSSLILSSSYELFWGNGWSDQVELCDLLTFLLYRLQTHIGIYTHSHDHISPRNWIADLTSRSSKCCYVYVILHLWQKPMTNNARIQHGPMFEVKIGEDS
jgi:hypothetical protein